MIRNIAHADSELWLDTIEPESLDACVTDPPYELGFMGRAWDSSGIAFQRDFWRKVAEKAALDEANQAPLLDMLEAKTNA